MTTGRVEIRAYAVLLAGLLLMSASAHAAGPARVAVLEFGNASSEPGLEALGKGLQSMVTTDLSQVAALTLVERARLQELVAEQGLSQTGAVDPATAVRIGKLAGATHLLTGSYTVVGKTMRLDARLFAVDSGEVVLAEAMSGEREAFFELEKALVGKLVKQLGVKLEAKERAGVARIHTADFGAFETFSQAVADFDAKRYDQALDALRRAMAMDAEFALARVTLAQYEALVAQIRQKATTIELSQRELAALEADQDFQRDTAIVARLLAVTKETGEAKRHRRLAALTFLIGLYDPSGGRNGRVSRFQDHFDALVVRRRAATLARRYLAEALPVFPAAPIFSDGRLPPDDPKELDKRIDGMAQALKRGFELRDEDRDRGLIANLIAVDDFVELVNPAPREAIELHELALAKLATFGARVRPDERVRLLLRVAELHLAAGDIDAASGALARASGLMTDPDRLQATAARIEALGRLSALGAPVSKQGSKPTDKQAALTELVAADNGVLSDDVAAELGRPGPLSRDLLEELASARALRTWWSAGDPYWLWGGLQAVVLTDAFAVVTGPRKEGLRADALRYYRAKGMDARDELVALGSGSETSVTASFTLDYERGQDFWPRQVPSAIDTPAKLKLDPGRPEVTFAFGLLDAATEPARDASGKSFYPHATRAYGVRLGGGKLALVRLGDDGPQPDLRPRELTVKVLSEVKLADTQRLTVRITVKGKAVEVDAGDSHHRFELPAALTEGFLGFHLRGPGYVEVGALRLDP